MEKSAGPHRGVVQVRRGVFGEDVVPAIAKAIKEQVTVEVTWWRGTKEAEYFSVTVKGNVVHLVGLETSGVHSFEVEGTTYTCEWPEGERFDLREVEECDFEAEIEAQGAAVTALMGRVQASPFSRFVLTGPAKRNASNADLVSARMVMRELSRRAGANEEVDLNWRVLSPAILSSLLGEEYGGSVEDLCNGVCPIDLNNFARSLREGIRKDVRDLRTVEEAHVLTRKLWKQVSDTQADMSSFEDYEANPVTTAHGKPNLADTIQAILKDPSKYRFLSPVDAMLEDEDVPQLPIRHHAIIVKEWERNPDGVLTRINGWKVLQYLMSPKPARSQKAGRPRGGSGASGAPVGGKGGKGKVGLGKAVRGGKKAPSDAAALLAAPKDDVVEAFAKFQVGESILEDLKADFNKDTIACALEELPKGITPDMIRAMVLTPR
jgi:hypothetical protein